MSMKNAFVGIIIILLAVGIAFMLYAVRDKKETIDLGKDLLDAKSASQGLRKFNSSQEIADYLRNSQRLGGFRGGRGFEVFGAAMDVTMPAAVAAEKSAGVGGGAIDYSQTNVQVQGVDEADFVKNDGRYIYTISGNKLVIVDAYPGEDAKIVSETTIEGNLRDLFVNKDKLILFVDAYEKSYTIPQFDYLPREKYTPKVQVLIYDLSDKANPKIVKNYSISGSYYQSRMIDDFVYVIAQEGVYYGNVIPLPVLAESGRIIARPDVYYFDNPEDNYVFQTIASFSADGGEVNAKTFMMGYANTLYVSQNNIYLAYQKNVPYSFQEKELEKRFYEVIAPLLPSLVQEDIERIKDDDALSSREKWDKISVILENMYNTLGEQEKRDLQEKMQKAVEEHEAKLEAERRKTVIHKIKINKGAIGYEKRGEVNGYLLNQFSLDEHEGNLRVATTTYIYTRDSTMYNNVYVLDEGMDVIGKAEDIAPDERIYSTRFIGDRLYMVTFKRIDPFFVIDLDPRSPKILGELKIPGFSDYLHPYDENYIIGVGKETESNEWGGVSTGGVKLALFDVSDVANPKQVGKYEIGRQGTDSEALQDHKAFLFDRKKNVLVIPVREVEERIYDSKYGYYKWKVWQGAYAFTVDTTHGFTLRGKISHGNDEENSYYGGPLAVRRSLFLDDYLYTISGKKLKANDLNTLAEIKEVSLPFTQEVYPRLISPTIMTDDGMGTGVVESGVAESSAGSAPMTKS